MSRELSVESRESAIARSVYQCDKCNEHLPFQRFLDGGRIASDTGWICSGCNRCPDCGGGLGNGHRPVHRCNVPVLTQALGVELSPVEKHLIRWLANSLDESNGRILAKLFIRARSGETP